MKKNFLFTGNEAPVSKVVPSHKVHHSRSVLRNSASTMIHRRDSSSMSLLNKSVDQIKPTFVPDPSIRKLFVERLHKPSLSSYQLPKVDQFIREWKVKPSRIALVSSKTKKLRLVNSRHLINKE